MTKKQEKIKEAYGQYWGALSEHAKKCALEHNGYIAPIISGAGEMPRYFLTYNDSGFRPRSLAGLEDNNGWISIESEADLPKESDNLFEVGLLDGIGCFHHERKRCAGKSVKYMWCRGLITHYQPIVKPKPPVY